MRRYLNHDKSFGRNCRFDKMATRLCLKRVKLFAKFPLRSPARSFCIAAAEVEKQSQETGQGKKKKEKDLDKVLAYEQYRENVHNTREIFRAEYEKLQAKERRRLEELNRGSFSPIEQHKRAVEDIKKYNENKEIARKTRQEEWKERQKIQVQKQKAENDAMQLERNRELVLEAIEESKSFVTMENLEEKIQEVLKTETNYNFALTADRRKIMSREPPSNLGTKGPGPAAYQGAGFKLRMKREQDSWKMRQTIDDDINKDDSSEASSSKSSDSESSDSESSGSDSESSGSDSESDQ